MVIGALPIRRLRHAALAAGLLMMCSGACAETTRTDVQRQAFIAAERALAAGRIEHFQTLAAQLRDYPLYPYLVFADLQRRLPNASSAEIHTFLANYAALPLAPQLRRAWLARLGQQAQWEPFLADYQPDLGDDLRCYYAQAVLAVHGPDAAKPVVEALWLTGHRLPHNCDALFKTWARSQRLTTTLVWERIHLAMHADHSRLALQLAQQLPADQRHWVALWQALRRDPEQLPKIPEWHQPTPVGGWILSDALQRLAARNAKAAGAYWRRIKDQAGLNSDQIGAVQRSIVLGLADQNDSPDEAWLAQVKDPATLRRLRTLHILDALKDGDWDAALSWMDRLNDDERGSERWRYWRARALEAMGHLDEAAAIYARLALDRGYYGFLAADRNGTGYRFEERPLVYRADELARVEDIAAVQRARELFFTDHIVEARREWQSALDGMNQAQLLTAAQLAHEWGWHDRAIIALSQAQYWDDLQLRFPLVYRDEIVAQAKRHDVDPAWAFAVIRQESAFATDARSPAGALGLMQLLPTTARRLAHSLRLPFGGRYDLLDAQTNIRLGIGYLKRVQERFSGHPVLATAAYNAGDSRVRQWLPAGHAMPSDLWIETVPYTETREYLKRVLTYTVIYQRRMGRAPVTLQERMPPVPSPSTRVSLMPESSANGA